MMREKTFQDECLKQLGYTTNPWEIEARRNSKASIGEPWVGKMNTAKSKGQTREKLGMLFRYWEPQCVRDAIFWSSGNTKMGAVGYDMHQGKEKE